MTEALSYVPDETSAVLTIRILLHLTIYYQEKQFNIQRLSVMLSILPVALTLTKLLPSRVRSLISRCKSQQVTVKGSNLKELSRTSLCPAAKAAVIKFTQIGGIKMSWVSLQVTYSIALSEAKVCLKFIAFKCWHMMLGLKLWLELLQVFGTCTCCRATELAALSHTEDSRCFYSGKSVRAHF